MVKLRKTKDPTNPRPPRMTYFLEWHCSKCGNYHVRKIYDSMDNETLYALEMDTTENEGRIRLAAPVNMSCKARPSVGDL